MVALVVMPAIMLAFGRTATYGEGVRLVVNRSGVIERVRQGAHDVAQTRDRLLGELADYIDTKLSPHPADASNEAAKAVLVRQG
jgi:oligoribonuclease (3'-5' exoribonuclease)